jgi:hypothetical protein
MNAQPRPIFQLAIAAMLMVTSVVAVAAEDFPGGLPDLRILEAQAKADELFEKGDYQRAYFIFHKELVPIGDKYAQYMVGYMNIVGKGVPRDYIAGSAWYRLAAERGEPSFTRVRDEVMGQFSDELQIQSDEKYAELRLDYSDAMIIAAYIEADLDLISRHLQNATLSNDLVDTQNSPAADRAQLVEEAQQRMQSRLQFLSDEIASGRPIAAAEIARIREVEERVQAAIQ